MNSVVKLREDNKKNYKSIYIILLLSAVLISYISIMNTQKLWVLYSLLAAISLILVSLIIVDIILRIKNKTKINITDTETIYYQSNNKNNKRLKVLIVIFDALSIISFVVLALYYNFVMKMTEIYAYYILVSLGAVLLFQVVILLKDILKIEVIDRVEASNSIFNIFSYDKKFLVILNMLLLCAYNITFLSIKKPHFIIYYKDLVIFNTIGFISLTLYIATLYISKKYYSNYDIKKLENVSLDTQIQDLIGKGEHASVYKAYVPSLDKILAIKRLDDTDVESIQRFENEFKIMKSLNHQNLVEVYKFNEIKMEYLMDYADSTLKDYLEKNALDNTKRMELINELLDGMEYLHSHKIMHRDLSYKNVMIKNLKDNEIILKITDFGLSKKKNEVFLSDTRTKIWGSLIDPTLEDFKRFNEQNDIYAVGMIINFIYYNEKSIHVADDPMSKLIYKCMDLDLSNRYKTITEIKNDIRMVM